MDRLMHGIIVSDPKKRHLLTEVASMLVGEFGETATLLKYSTTGWWFCKKAFLEFKVVEDAHYICHESVKEVIESIFDRDGDIYVKYFELSDISPEEEVEDECIEECDNPEEHPEETPHEEEDAQLPPVSSTDDEYEPDDVPKAETTSREEENDIP